ncbi:MAG: helix-turn-helix transcriptional regulator [Streptococcus sp.]
MSKLRELRKARNMTQSELAKEIKVSEKTISRWGER